MIRYVAGAVPRIELRSGASIAEVAPSRGGMITRYFQGDREHLFLDKATLGDPSKNVRGGVPILFPSPGKLTDDRWARDGHGGTLKQHGFARNLTWHVVEEGPDARVVLRIEDSSETRASYPWSFRFDLAYTLSEAKLQLDGEITNTGNPSLGAMPFGFGFHPYFLVPSAMKGEVRVTSKATRAFDNKRGVDVDFDATTLDLAHDEVDLHLLDHEGRASALEFADGRRLHVYGTEPFRRWVIWTLPQRDFVCLEPWSCPGDALNTGAQLSTLAAGESLKWTLVIRPTSP